MVLMPKYAQSLKIKDIKGLTKPGMYSIGYVPGLCVRVTRTKVSYYFRYQIHHISRYVIIGDVKFISLNQAKSTAYRYKATLLMGGDPAIELKKNKEELLKKVVCDKDKRNTIKATSFILIAQKYISYKKDSGGFANNRRGESTCNSMLEKHVYQYIKNKPIDDVTIYDIRDILAKVWTMHPSLSKKLVSLLRQIFDWAIAMKYIPENRPNPVDMKGPLKTLMEPYQQNKAEGEHFPSLDYHKMPEFMLEVWNVNTLGAKCLFFSLLTATRSQAARFLAWDQLNMKKATWEIPIKSDKIKKKNSDRTILLSPQAIYLLRTIKRTNSLVFPSESFTPLSDATLGKVIKDLNIKRANLGKELFVDYNILNKDGKPRQITQHGTSRSTFRTWAKSDELGNHRKYYQEAAELCLLHQKKDPNKGAYDRAKLDIEKRKIINAWGKYCCSLIPELQDL